MHCASKAVMTSRVSLRILILNWRYVGHPRAGGAEYWTQCVAEGLRSRGHHVTVFTSAVKGCAESENVNGVHVLRRGGQFSVYFFARRFLRRSNCAFDVVLDEVNTRPFFAHRHFDGHSCAMFHQVAEEVWDYEAPRFLRTIGRRYFEPKWLRMFQGRRVLALSNSTAKSLARYGITNVSVIHPGVDQIESTTKRQAETPTVCVLGRLVESKRPLDALFAFAELKKRFPEAQCVVIGDGPLRAQIELLNLSSVNVTGFVPISIRNELVASSHVLLATSVREGWGMNVTEAAELGTLTIGYNVDGLSDSIAITNGILVDPEPKALAEALIRYFSDNSRPIPRKLNRPWSEVVADLEAYFLEMCRNQTC